MTKPLLPDNWLQHRLNGSFHRQLVLIKGSQSQTIALAEQIREGFSDHCLWIGRQTDKAGVDCSEYRQYLGREYDLLVYNAFSGMRANALMALSGTVKHNGLMLLLCPEAEHWPSFADPQQRKRFSYGFEQVTTQSVFVCWLLAQADADKQVLVLEQHGMCGETAPLITSRTVLDGPCITADQQQAVAAIIKVATGHRNRPLILTADRGRGKSSALGIAAASLITDRQKNILVTAPTLGQTEQVFTHAAENVPDCENSPRQLLSKQGGGLRFKPVDQILRDKTPADLLIVDEAAAIPSPLLKSLAGRYSRIVFCSTVHGYEGSGRGFELRFQPALRALRPQSQHLHLNQPIRWYQGDCLERFWFKVMLMDRDDNNTASQRININNTELRQLEPALLIRQPDLLHQLFQLLINAHYQTSPDDLQRLLDAPQSRVFVIIDNNTIVAAILADEEGGKRLTSIANGIAAGERRAQGHLLAQNLSNWTNDSSLACLRYLRIVRIAVAPQHWRKGLGSYALKQLQIYARDHQFDFVGSAFGATAELARFWHKSDFIACRLGLKQDMASGEHSMIVLRALSDRAITCLTALLEEFQREFLALLPGFFRSIEPDLVEQVVRHFPAINALSDKDAEKLSQFAKGYGTPETVILPLQQLSLWRCQQRIALDDAGRALIRYSLQYHSPQHICEEFALNGRNALATILRQCAETYLNR